jgi:catechol 2,3-dioxygenase-like lactoylglutathione lyase family enzyme
LGRRLSDCDGMDRRRVLLGLPATFIASRVLAQPSGPLIAARHYNNVMIAVSDLSRSLSFYRKLFGAPVLQSDAAVFRVGDGSQFFALTQARAGAGAEILSYGLAVDDFAADRLAQALAGHGGTEPRLTRRGDTPELFLNDPNGVRIQLQDGRYMHGSGPRGEVLSPAPGRAGRPAFDLRTINHVTLNTTEGTKSLAFYRDVFGLTIQSRQGSVVSMGIGSSRQSVAFNTAANGGGAGGINHVCFTIKSFDPAHVMGVLADSGLEPIEVGNPSLIKPLTCRVRFRQHAANGGGPTSPLGTPELYFTDPDNIAIQLQDVSYCGGSGWLGQICS